jgi:hypothetical protein
MNDLGFGGIHASFEIILFFLLLFALLFMLLFLCCCLSRVSDYIVVYTVVYTPIVFLFVWSMMLSNLCTRRPHFDVAAVHFSLYYFISKLVDAWQALFS